jgi:hypothetical protein
MVFNKMTFFLALPFVISCSMLHPSRPASVPLSCEWVGGTDGGVWVDEIVTEDSIRLDVYDDYYGKKINSILHPNTCGCKKIKVYKKLNFYDGRKFFCRDRNSEFCKKCLVPTKEIPNNWWRE